MRHSGGISSGAAIAAALHNRDAGPKAAGKTILAIGRHSRNAILSTCCCRKESEKNGGTRRGRTENLKRRPHEAGSGVQADHHEKWRRPAEADGRFRA